MIYSGRRDDRRPISVTARRRASSSSTFLYNHLLVYKHTIYSVRVVYNYYYLYVLIGAKTAVELF